MDEKIAIVGAGLCGLACCYHLLQKGGTQVTLFDSKGIGGGASGVASGLLHPYPGERGRRTWQAEEAMQATSLLLQVAETALQRPVALYNGILRYKPLLSSYPDVEPLPGDTFLIRSGITVHTRLYLEGLWQACQQRGALLSLLHIPHLKALDAYDIIILSAGAGIFEFPEAEHLRLTKTKGQVLTCTLTTPLERSKVGKGYVACGETPDICYVGATYERKIFSSEPDQEMASTLLHPTFSSFFPNESPKIIACRAGIRVSSPQGYKPLIARLTPKCWTLSGMRSRGLLYHAYFAEQLATIISCASHRTR